MANRKVTLLLALLPLTGCTYIADFLLKDKPALEVDTQIGDTANKVRTGLGSLGSKSTNTLSVKDSSNVTLDNKTSRYHITTGKETTVNVYETNYWLYSAFALFLIGKPLLRKFWAWKTR